MLSFKTLLLDTLFGSIFSHSIWFKRFLLNDSGCNRLFVFDRYFEDLKINIYLKLNWCLWNMSFRGFSAVNSGSKDVFSKLGFSNWKLHKLGSNWKLKKHAQHIWVQITFQGAISSFQLFSLFICSLLAGLWKIFLIFWRFNWQFSWQLYESSEDFLDHSVKDERTSINDVRF